MVDWITEPAALESSCARWRAADAIGLDTEFMRVRTYYPELALVQLADGASIALVDPVGGLSLEPLRPLLTQPPPVLVMHSASEDLVAFAPIAQAPLLGLFDTQVAAAFAGLGAGIGYQRIVAEVLGIAIDKGETRSNWLARPLSAEQLRYAAADVEHLLPLYDALRERLRTRNMLAWCEDECRRIAIAAADGDAPANAHWEFRNAWRWPLEKQARLKRLLEWREATARRVNRPRLWLFDNPTAIALLDAGAASAAELGTKLASQKSFPKRELGKLHELLSSPLAPGELEIEPIPEPLKGDADQRFERLREHVAKRAAELDLPAALLASRRVLESAARGEAAALAPVGWRAEALGGALEAE